MYRGRREHKGSFRETKTCKQRTLTTATVATRPVRAACEPRCGIGYGQFSKLHVCFCGLDPGNLKFETVRTHRQHICF